MVGVLIQQAIRSDKFDNLSQGKLLLQSECVRFNSLAVGYRTTGHPVNVVETLLPPC